MKRVLVMIMCAALLGLSACGNKKMDELVSSDCWEGVKNLVSMGNDFF